MYSKFCICSYVLLSGTFANCRKSVISLDIKNSMHMNKIMVFNTVNVSLQILCKLAVWCYE